MPLGSCSRALLGLSLLVRCSPSVHPRCLRAAWRSSGWFGGKVKHVIHLNVPGFPCPVQLSIPAPCSSRMLPWLCLWCVLEREQGGSISLSRSLPRGLGGEVASPAMSHPLFHVSPMGGEHQHLLLGKGKGRGSLSPAEPPATAFTSTTDCSEIRIMASFSFWVVFFSFPLSCFNIRFSKWSTGKLRVLKM